MRTHPAFPGVLSRAGSIPFLLLSVLLQACSSSSNPLDPVNPPDVQQPPAAQPPVVSQPPDEPEPPDGEPAPNGTLEVSVVGSDAAFALGYFVLVYFDGVQSPRAVRGTGAITRIPNLPPGSHSVVLHASARNCAADDSGPRPFSIVGGETSQIGFTISCSAAFGFVAGVYERTSYYAPSVEFHGTLSERYVIDADGSFRLQFDSGRYGSFAYPGGLSLISTGGTETLFVLAFSANNGQWSATATLRGNCLVVEYNTDMWLSDFEHGVYCRAGDGS
jgi:hypothetical protein